MEVGRNLLDRKFWYSLFWISLSLFILNYVFLYLLSGFLTLYFAFDLDIPATLLMNQINFAVEDTDPLWTKDAVVSIFLSGPLSSFALGSMGLLFFQLLPRKSILLLMSVIWLFLHAFNRTFGLVVEEVMLSNDLMRVASEMGIKQTMIIFSMALSIFFLLKSGSFAGKMFYYYFPDCEFFRKNNRLKLFVSFFLLPWFVGSLMIILLPYPHILLKDIILMLLMLFLIIPIAFTSYPAPSNSLRFSDNIPGWFFPIITLVILIGFRWWVGSGFSF